MLDRTVSFRSLLTPVTPEQFFQKYRGREHLLIRGDEEKFVDVFSWEDLNRITNMTSVWSNMNMRLALNAEVIDAKHYCSPGRSRDNASVMKPDFHKVADFMEQGATLNLNFVELLHEGIAAVARALQMIFSAPVKCNVYSSRKQKQAFPSHFDMTDVFAMHIAGEKVWRIYENRYDMPAEAQGHRHASFPQHYHEENKGEVLQEFTMTPGDLLYIPKGTYHDALATTDASLHLTFGIVEIRGFEVAANIFNSLADEPLFRESLPGLDDRAGLEKYLRRMGDRLREILTLPEITDQVRAHQKHNAFLNLPGFSFPFPMYDQTFRVTSRPAKVVTSGKTRRLKCGDRDLELAAGQAEMVEWILDGDYFDIDSLVAAFNESQVVLTLIEALVGMGMIEPVASAATEQGN